MPNDGSDYLRRFNRKFREDGPYSTLRATLKDLRYRYSSPYASTKQAGVEWLRYIKYRTKYGPSIPKPSNIIYVNPESVSLTLPRRVVPESSHPFEEWANQRSYYGIIGGDWDCHAIPITESPHYQGIYERYVEGKDWENTSEYTNHKNRGWSENKIRRHFDDVEKLFNSMKQNGYNHKWPVTLHITRNGEFIRRNGFHRVTIARILDISKIPAKVKLRHKQWQKLRNGISETDSKTELSQQAQVNLNHPDLQEFVD